MSKKFFKSWAKMFFKVTGTTAAIFAFCWGLAWIADRNVILAMGVFTLVAIALGTAASAWDRRDEV
jgi:hypothetical protein